MGVSMVPSPENMKILTDRFEKTRQRLDKLVAKKIDPVYFEMAEKIGGVWCKESRYAPWILERMMTPLQARISLALPDVYRDPSWGKERLEVSEQFAKDLGMDKKTVDKELGDLRKTGQRFLAPTRKGYQIPRTSHFFTHGAGYKDTDPDLADMCWVFGRWEEQQAREKVVEAAKASSRKLAGWAMVPRWRAIKDIPGVLPVEDMREIFKSHQRFSLLRCVCRRDDLGRQCDTPEQVCFTFDRGADNTIAAGTGKELTLAEALDWYDSLREHPTVTLLMGGTTEALKDPKQLNSMCQCHWDCCLAMMPWYMSYSNYSITDFILKTRFRATVDPEKCIGCRRCIDERCQFWGAQMKYYPEFGGERAYIDEEKCAGCGNCVETCPVGARGMKVVEGPEYITEIGLEEGVSGDFEGIKSTPLGAEKTIELWARLDKEKKLAKEEK